MPKCIIFDRTLFKLPYFCVQIVVFDTDFRIVNDIGGAFKRAITHQKLLIESEQKMQNKLTRSFWSTLLYKLLSEESLELAVRNVTVEVLLKLCNVGHLSTVVQFRFMIK